VGRNPNHLVEGPHWPDDYRAGTNSCSFTHCDIRDKDHPRADESISSNVNTAGRMYARTQIGAVLQNVVMIDGCAGVNVDAVAYARSSYDDNALAQDIALAQHDIGIQMHRGMNCIHQFKASSQDGLPEVTAPWIVGYSYNASLKAVLATQSSQIVCRSKHRQSAEGNAQLRGIIIHKAYYVKTAHGLENLQHDFAVPIGTGAYHDDAHARTTDRYM